MVFNPLSTAKNQGLLKNTAHLTGRSSLHSMNSSIGDPPTKTRETLPEARCKSLKPSMNIEHIENMWWSKIFRPVSTSRFNTFTIVCLGFKQHNRTTYINLHSFTGCLPSTPYHKFDFYVFAFCPSSRSKGSQSLHYPPQIFASLHYFCVDVCYFSTLRSLVFHHLERETHLNNISRTLNSKATLRIFSASIAAILRTNPSHIPIISHPKKKGISQSYLGLSAIFCWGDRFLVATLCTNEHVGHKPSGHSKTCEASVAGPAASRGAVGLSKGGWMEDGRRMLLSK